MIFLLILHVATVYKKKREKNKAEKIKVALLSLYYI